MEVITDLKGRELKKIIKKSGYTQAEFAEHVQKARSFTTRLCDMRIVPPKWVEEFIDFLGEAMFEKLFNEVRGKDNE